MAELSGKQQAETALAALREIEKARLKLGAEVGVMPAFPDFAVNALVLISDIAGNAIRRVEGPERHDPQQKS
jgi:hypothetical protein